DARAARDEVARLAVENDSLRARLDERAPPPAGTTAAPDTAESRAGAVAADDTARRDTDEELHRERARAEEAARVWRAQVDEARADAARERARAHKLDEELRALRGGARTP